IYTTLYKISTQEELIDPTLGILKPLFRDGPKNKNELLDTLNCYVYQNGNIKETAEKLYCHYNSVLYRLERIETILGISIREPEHFFRVQLAVRLLSFIKQYKPYSAQQYLR
ncbi:MAG: helix-turn-helix domain-containing protein, partial [Sulfobacillus sp.]